MKAKFNYVNVTFLNFSWKCIDLSNKLLVPNDVNEIPYECNKEKNIKFFGNALSETWKLNIKIKILDISYNTIDNWTQMMKNLIYLDVSGNPLDDLSLHYFPVIQFLFCSYCGLQRLKGHSHTLQYLICNDNLLTNLPLQLPEILYIKATQNKSIKINNKCYPKLTTLLIDEVDKVEENKKAEDYGKTFEEW